MRASAHLDASSHPPQTRLMSVAESSETTRLLRRVQEGDDEAREELPRRTEDKLRVVAGAAMRREGPDHTLQATALINEAWAQLLGRRSFPHFSNGRHFLAAMAVAMRNFLCSYARRKRSARAGGLWIRVLLEEAELAEPIVLDADAIAFEEAVRQLRAVNPDWADIVEYRFYLDRKGWEIAELLGLSEDQVDRRLRAALAWLKERLGREAL